MGTRHLIAVIKEKKVKVAQYGQWDGYPSYRGVRICDWLNTANLAKFAENIDKCRWITKKEADALNEQLNKPNADINKICPLLSRDTSEGVLIAIEKGEQPEYLLTNSYSFAKDSLFCEWAYVIDLDKRTFEVYEGFNKSPLPKGERFGKGIKADAVMEYYPVRLRKVYSLDSLPTPDQFLADFRTKPDGE